MTRKIAIICWSYALFLFAACNKIGNDDKCISIVPAFVSEVNGPTTGAVNQDINLNVSFPCFNGCGQFETFEKSSNADTTIIKVFARYEGCVCTMDAPTRTTTYTFRTAQAGTYHLKFMQTPTLFLVHSITIQ